VNWTDLNSDVKNGTFKFFANKVDEVLHAPNAVPELKLASQILDATDRGYGEAMRVFNAKELNAVMKGLEAGEPADPKVLFNLIAKEGHTDLTTKIMDMIGPQLATGVKAADVKTMMDASKSITGGVEGKRFVAEVADRYRSGMLQSIHGEAMANKLLKQAQNILALEGKIDVKVRPGDTAMDIIGKARTAADAAKEAAKDPLVSLNKAMKQVEREHELEKMQISLQRSKAAGPLGFMYEPNLQAMHAVDRILGSEDMVLAAAAKFGHQSPEFNMLRQIYARRVLEGSMNLSSKLAKISPEVQSLMFPGVSLKSMQTLAKEMDFLTSTRSMQTGAGKSIMAQAAVEHPWGRVLGKGGEYLPKLPGGDAIGRATIGKYYDVVLKLSNNLPFMRWVEKGLKGNEQARAMVKKEVQRAMQKGGALGAGVAESQFQTPQQPGQ